MSTRKMTIEIPLDLYAKFKVRCINNHTTVKDEVTDMICASLEGATTEEVKKDETPDEAFEREIAAPSVDHSVSHGWRHFKEEDLEAELKPIREKLENLSSGIKDLVDWRVKVRTWSQDLQADIDHKFVVTGKLIDSVMVALEKTTSAKKCDDDRKGLALLRGESG